MIIQFNFNNYFDNPIVKYCHKRLSGQLNTEITVLTLNDVVDIIKECNLKNSMYSLEHGMYSYIGDQLRVYFGLNEDITYIDGDVLIKDINILKQNDVMAFEKSFNQVNNGAFFHGCKEFNRYYFDKYQSYGLYGMSNFDVFNRYKYDTKNMKLIDNNHYHFYMSLFREIKSNVKLILDKDSNSCLIMSKIPKLIISECNFVDRDEFLKVIVEQVEYQGFKVID